MVVMVQRRGTRSRHRQGWMAAELALHNLDDEAHGIMGDARKEIQPSMTSSVRPTAAMAAWSGTRVETT